MKYLIIITLLIAAFFSITANDYITHTVKEKETLWRICKNYNVIMEDVITLNGISDGTSIKKGQLIKIPQKKESTKAPVTTKVESYTMHTVKPDETLWRICRTYGVNVDRVIEVNNIEDITSIKVGTVIKVPGASKTETTNQLASTGYNIHIVKKDETLWRISKQYGTTVDAICSLNKIHDTSKVKTGMSLKVPGNLRSANASFKEFSLPVVGEVKRFTSAHFKGIHIFTGTTNEAKKIRAVSNGEVSYLDTVPGYGLTIFIRHSNGYISTYSGLEEAYIAKNTHIKSGQVIGKAGNLSRYNKYGILFSIQHKGKGLKYDTKKQKFIGL